MLFLNCIQINYILLITEHEHPTERTTCYGDNIVSQENKKSHYQGRPNSGPNRGSRHKCININHLMYAIDLKRTQDTFRHSRIMTWLGV